MANIDNSDIVAARQLATHFGVMANTLRLQCSEAELYPAPDGLPPNARWYSLKRMAKLLTERSGHTIKANEIGRLINSREAKAILDKFGCGRTLATFHNWKKAGVGPRTFRFGKMDYYLQSEVNEWAYFLYHFEPMPNGSLTRDRLLKQRYSNAKQSGDQGQSDPNGPNGESPVSWGSEGGSLHFSRSDQGAE